MRWRDRRRAGPRRALIPLALAAAVLGAGGTLAAPAHAQGSAAVQTGDDLFGSYDLSARGLGVEARYEVQGLLPGGAPVLDLTSPETDAKFGSGPTGYGLSSIAYPGGLIVNLGSLVAQEGADPSTIPDYPIKSEVFFPAGPLDAAQNQAGATEMAHATQLGINAVGTFPGVDANPVIQVKSISSSSLSDIEGGKAVARTRVVVGGVSILGGVISIDSLVTDLVAAHDGVTGTASGGTTATGVKFLGLAASLGPTGLVLDQAPAVTGPGAALGSVLNPVLAPLKQLTAPVQALLQQVLAQAVPSLNNVLANAGLSVQVLGGGPVTAASGAAGYRSGGLAINIDYQGKDQAALQQLINSIPDSLKPSLGPLPNPIAFLTDNHLTGITLGQGTVSALASAPFANGGGTTGGTVGATTGDTSLPSFVSPGGVGPGDFTTPLPVLPAVSSGGAAVRSLGDTANAVASAAVPAGMIVLLLLAAPFLGLASRRLADNVLAPVTTSCPSGLDEPPSTSRQA